MGCGLGDLFATIAEAARVLRPGGRLIVIERAKLLSRGLLQPFLLLAQALVYGPSAVFGRRTQRSRSQQVPRSFIPLRQHGLQPHFEHIYSQRWEVYMTIGYYLLATLS